MIEVEIGVEFAFIGDVRADKVALGVNASLEGEKFVWTIVLIRRTFRNALLYLLLLLHLIS